MLDRSPWLTSHVKTSATSRDSSSQSTPMTRVSNVTWSAISPLLSCMLSWGLERVSTIGCFMTCLWRRSRRLWVTNLLSTIILRGAMWERRMIIVCFPCLGCPKGARKRLYRLIGQWGMLRGLPMCFWRVLGSSSRRRSRRYAGRYLRRLCI